MSSFRVILLFALLSLIGLAVSPFLSLNFIPTTDSNSFTVSFAYPGKSPLSVEREVTSLVESELSQLEGLSAISSTSRTGGGHVILSFDSDEDLQFKQQQIFTFLRRLNLPKDAGRPRVTRHQREEEAPKPLIILEVRFEKLDEVESVIQDRLVSRLGSIPHVSTVEVSGLNRRVINVAYDPERLLSNGLSRSDLLKRIDEHTRSIDFPNVDKNGHTLGLSYAAPAKTMTDLSRIPVTNHLMLSDLAKVNFKRERTRTLLRINGKEAIFLSLMAENNANRLRLAGQVKAEIARLNDLFPEIEMVVNYDDSEYLSAELSKAGTRAILALSIIALFGLLSYSSWRYLIVFSVSILVNSCLISLCAWGLGIEIHLYTLAGIAISFGLIVDNSIMIIDDYKRGRKRKNILPQLAASGTTIAALMVVFFLPNEWRENLTELVLIVSVALTCSFLVSWFLIPALAEKMSLSEGRVMSVNRIRWFARLKNAYGRFLAVLSKRKKWVIAFCVWSFGLPVFLLPTNVEGWDGYNASIGSDFYQEHLRPHINKWLGGSSRLFYQNVYERSSYRTPEKTKLFMRASLSFGHTLEHMDGTIRKVENYLNSFPEISKFVTRVTSGQQGFITIEFKEEHERSAFPYILKNKLTQRSLQWGGVDWSIYGVGRGFSNSASDPLPSFRVTLKGYDYNKLGQVSEAMAVKLLSHKRIQKVNTNARSAWSDQKIRQFELSPKKWLFEEYLESLQEVGHYARQDNSSIIDLGDDTYPVYIQARGAEEFSLFSALHLPTKASGLAQSSSLSLNDVPNAIYREERQYLRFLSFDYYGSYRFGNEYLEGVLKEIESELPLGYEVSKVDWSWNSEKEKRKYEMVLLSIVLILIIGILFTENIKRAMLIISIIPLSFVGVFLTFSWGNFYFDQGGYAAFLFVTGLSVNAFLFILGDYTYYRKRGSFEAITKSTFVKFWPVLLTVLSTCLGFIPFLINGSDEIFWFSLAVGTIGGLLVSFVVTFLVVPMLIQE